MRAMDKALQLGRSAMMLVPEIALTPVFSQQLARALWRSGRDLSFVTSERRAI